ncbi:MAG: dienelactone hydrolase family protein [Nitrospirae bacterium]|nr:dienelactone hydrolase family protein [Nitrospirota bacterium]
MKTLNGIMILMLFFLVTACSTLQTREIDYSSNGQALKGYLAYDNNIKGKRPGVLVVHEWWGNNEYTRKRARMLAELGYTAFALDMYGDGKQATHPNEAGKFAEEVRRNKDEAEKRFMAALNLLRAQKTVNPDQIAAIGYCFGGGVVLQMARMGVDLDGVVSFHGSLSTDTPAEPGVVKARVLVLHGADDSFVTPEQVDQFKKEMQRAGVDYRFVAYPGAMHAFTNPEADSYGKKFNIPLKYDPEADRQSWIEMKSFFKSLFR